MQSGHQRNGICARNSKLGPKVEARHEFLHTKLHSKLEMCHGVGCHEERPAVQRLSTRPWTKMGRDGFLKVPRNPLTDGGSHQVKPDPSDLACS